MTTSRPLRVAITITPRIMAEALATALRSDAREVIVAADPAAVGQYDVAVISADTIDVDGGHLLRLPVPNTCSGTAHLVTAAGIEPLAVTSVDDVLAAVERLCGQAGA